MKVNYKVLEDCRGKSEDYILQKIFQNRNIEESESFLHPIRDDIINLSAFKNIQKGYDLLYKNIKSNRPIVILADNDVDGVTSCSIIYRYLQHITTEGQVKNLIGCGKKHGMDSLPPIGKNGGLLIVVDSIDEIERYNPIITDGWDILCLDHHIVPQSVLNYVGENFVLISSANEYKNPELTGAGVCLKFCMYIDYQNLTNYSDNLYDLAACGIVADLGSMLSPENRYIVYKGLNNINNLGIKKAIGNYEFNTTSILFSIAPIVNACVRMNKNEFALKLFTENDEEVIEECIKIGKQAKQDQNELIEQLMPQVESQIQKQINDKTIFLCVDPRYRQISGVLANKIMEKMQRPIIIYHIRNDGTTSGSMRAIGVSDFTKYINETGIAECKGHELSAGFFGHSSKMDELKDKLEEALINVEFSTDVFCDILINTNQVTDSFIKNIKIINRISGNGFKPINVMIESDDITVSSMSNGKHLKIIDNSTGMLFIKWNYNFIPKSNKKYKIKGVGTLDTAFYGRTRYKQLILDNFELMEE